MKKTRQNKSLDSGSHAIRTDKTPGAAAESLFAYPLKRHSGGLAFCPERMAW
jgi:hypothetical protein